MPFCQFPHRINLVGLLHSPPPYTAAGAVAGSATAHPAIITTAQADQYRRDAEATVQAYQMTVEANYQHVQATAQSATSTAVWLTTAQAISVQATQQSLSATGTAQAIELAALAQAATTAAQATATAQSAQVTTTASAVSAQATAASIAATRQTWELQQAQAQAHREQVISIAAYVFLGIFSLLLLGLGGYFLWQLIPALIHRASLVRYGQHGNPLLLLNRGGRTILTDPLAMLQAAVTIDEQGHVTMPDLTPAELQTLLAGGRLRLLMEQAARAPGHPPPLLGRVSSSPVSSFELKELGTQNSKLETPLPPDAPWSLLQSWNGPGLPLGLGTSGLLLADPETYPHLLLAGTSGSGKTRYGLRPLITSALAAGWKVLIYDRSGLDFLPFQQHPNAHTILLSEAGQAIFHLAHLYEEILRRFTILRQAQVSTWGRLDTAPAPRLLAVVDEFANLADSLPASQREELWRYARMIAAEGRKAGVHLALALQDPTHKSLDLRIRRNCLPLSFRVKDGDASRVVLGMGGAEQLPPRHFLTVMEQVQEGVAFAPSDSDIQQFLAQRPIFPHPAPSWLQPGSLFPQGLPAGAPSATNTEEQIRTLLAAGWSLRAVQREVFGYTGGAAYETVRAVQEILTRSDTAHD